tara:strand:- start:1579 stop:4008 length:2430 start_codon:yes stop_codon:yes gene_type:complete
MEFFRSIKSELFSKISNSELPIILSKISIKYKKYNNVEVYTYKLKDKLDDDKEYGKYKSLIDLLPRACSIFVIDGQIQKILEGNKKFSGKTAIDEDPENDYSNLVNTSIYDHNEILDWAKNGNLEITYTEKENGKNCVASLFSYNDNLYLIAGSKNMHIPIKFEILSNESEWNDFKTKYSICDLTLGIFEDIRSNLKIFLSDFSKKEFLEEKNTIVGEYCDGQHFCDGNNTIKWFSISNNGNAKDPIESLKNLKKAGYNVVNYKTVYDSQWDKSNLETIEKIFEIGRTDEGEGGVLYCTNKITGKVILVKNKAVGYIFKRIARQCILRGYRYIEDISRRVCETKDYHKLNTVAAANYTKLLYDFGMWMMNKSYPCKIIGHTPVHSVKKHLDNGFNIRWKEFLTETGNSDIKLNQSDIGNFDNDEFFKILGDIYPIRNRINSPIVCMIQGLQGSGKSTLGNALCQEFNSNYKIRYYEQDEFWGCTLSCQGALYHDIRNSNGSEIIVLTRCNANQKQYEKYLDLFHNFNCKVFFTSPLSYNNPLYLAVSIAGVINRSDKGDKLMVGRFESDLKDAVKFINDNYTNFEIPDNTLYYPVYYPIKDETIEIEAAKFYAISLEEFSNFVSRNVDRLNNIRIGLSQSVFIISNEIKNILHYKNSNKLVKCIKNPEYSGFFINDINKEKLQKVIIETVGLLQNFKLYCSHVTQFYIGKNKKNVSIPENICEEFNEVYINISEIVIRFRDNSCCFKIDSIIDKNTGKIIQTQERVHLTGYLPNTINPKESNSFVDLYDETVKRIPYPEVIDGICLWKK